MIDKFTALCYFHRNDKLKFGGAFMHRFDNSFWSALDALVGKSEIIIDRPKGTAHTKYNNFI